MPYPTKFRGYLRYEIGLLFISRYPLQLRHNERDGVQNRRRLHRLFNRLFKHKSKKISKLRVTGLCEGNSPVTGEFPHKEPVKGKMFPFDDVIMLTHIHSSMTLWHIHSSMTLWHLARQLQMATMNNSFIWYWSTDVNDGIYPVDASWYVALVFVMTSIRVRFYEEWIIHFYRANCHLFNSQQTYHHNITYVNICYREPVIYGYVHEDVITWKQFLCYWSFVRGIHRSPVLSQRTSKFIIWIFGKSSDVGPL